MKLLVFSDIHGNLAALEAVTAVPHDQIVCLGDLVGYGPHPGACVHWLRSYAGVVLQGNHDHSLANGTPPGCGAEFEWLAEALAPLGRIQVSPDERAWLDTLSASRMKVYDGRRYLLVHATPSDPLYRYLGPDPAGWEAEVGSLEVDAVLVGHTHLQFELTVAGKQVVNPGSVGQPKDGDPRAAYAVLENGTIRLERIAYDVERTVAELQEAPVDRDAAADLSLLLRTGRPPPPRKDRSTRA